MPAISAEERANITAFIDRVLYQDKDAARAALNEVLTLLTMENKSGASKFMQSVIAGKGA